MRRCMKTVGLGVWMLTVVSPVAAQPAMSIDLHQNWSQEQREKFWFTSQGSQLLPYTWFLALEQASSSTLFRDPANMERLGYLPARASTLNQDGLPIGFAHDVAADGQEFVGFTCAACHTTKLRMAGTPVIVEGAPTLGDFSTFLTELVDALEATLKSQPKLDAFKDKVVGTHTGAEADALEKALRNKTDDLSRRWILHASPTPYGPGRLDAFGGLYNQVVAYDLAEDANARVPDAPVSYPFLWDTPQHNKVQWNGSGDNRLLAGLGRLGPLFRNIGEALGVFGWMDFTPKGGAPKYRSSLQIDALKNLETLVKSLRSPVWPAGVFAVDPALVGRGETLYKEFCIDCHKIIKDPADPNRKAHERMIDVADVGTDGVMLANYAERFKDPSGAATGPLKDHYKISWPGEKFKERAAGGEIFANAVLGAYLGRTSTRVATGSGPASRTASGEAVRDQITLKMNSVEVAVIRQFTAAIQKSEAAYKARPLNGVWATAPYLHNGSVPTIWELLKPPCDRVKQFYVGSRDFDEKDLGLSTEQVSGAFPFDTTRPGNSNAGHSYGTTLKEDQKRALLEYLKCLGSPCSAS